MGQDSLGQRIRALRREKGLSQAELAQPDLSDSYISLIESDKRTPTAEVVELLAGKLGCSAAYLSSGTTPQVRAELQEQLSYARLALDNGEIDEAVRRFADLLRDDRAGGVPVILAEARWGHALALEAAGSLEAAATELAALWDGYSAHPDSADLERRAELAIVYCRCLRESGALSEAITVGEAALAELAEPGDPLGGRRDVRAWSDVTVPIGATLLAAYHERGDLARAQQLAARLVAVAESGGGNRARVAAYWNAGLVAAARGRHESALRFTERALAIADLVPDLRNLARLPMLHGIQLVRSGRVAEGHDLLAKAEKALVDSPASAVDIALCRAQRSWARTLLGDPEEAAVLARRALTGLGAGQRLVRATALLSLGHALLSLGRIEEAREALAEAAEQLTEMQSSREAAQALYQLGGLLGGIGDRDGQIGAYRSALASIGL
ncbi:MAG TPA: helix-turn-helix domain-containing protein [Streptosporangiaceae bacterium]|jgi:tetratricopeptide (TPR) repeat protein